MSFHRDQESREKIARNFSDSDVARTYAYRPKYPTELLDFLANLAERRERALDIGCGNGKISIYLSSKFGEVVSLDPSDTMISEAIRNAGEERGNIKWVHSRAEDFQYSGKFDLVVAGNSIHWTEHEILFPKLAQITDTVAIVSGDSPEEPPCGKAKWKGIVESWLNRLSEIDADKWKKYDPHGFRKEANRHEEWLEILGRETFSQKFRQSLDNFIEMQHSQATWARSSMGSDLSARFDIELRNLMSPYASNGFLEMEIVSEIAWGRPRMNKF